MSTVAWETTLMHTCTYTHAYTCMYENLLTSELWFIRAEVNANFDPVHFSSVRWKAVVEAAIEPILTGLTETEALHLRIDMGIDKMVAKDDGECETCELILDAVDWCLVTGIHKEICNALRVMRSTQSFVARQV